MLGSRTNNKNVEAVMKPFAMLAVAAALAACGVPPEEDISAKSDFSPLGSSYFFPVDADELKRSKAWGELVDSYN